MALTQTEKTRRYYYRHREKILAKLRGIKSRTKAYYLVNKEKVLERQHRRHAVLRTTTSYIFDRIGRSAKQRGLSFNMTLDEFSIFFWGKPCFYCGDSFDTIGLDRVDSSIGYEVSNVVSCCARCNKAKHAMSQVEFLALCRKITERHPFDSRKLVFRPIGNARPLMDKFTQAGGHA